MRTGCLILEAVKPRDWTQCPHLPDYTVTANPDRSVLITIITSHFKFHPMNISILYLKVEFSARSQVSFKCQSH